MSEIRWEHEDAEGVLNDGRLSIFAPPSMTRDDGVVAVGIDAPWITDLQARARDYERVLARFASEGLWRAQEVLHKHDPDNWSEPDY